MAARRLPVYDSRVVADLSNLLAKVSPDQLRPIAEVALRFIVTHEASVEVGELAAQMNSRPDQIRPVVHGLSSAFWECAKARLSDELFLQAMTQVSTRPEINQLLLECYLAKKEDIMQSTSAFGMALPEYQHLDWRIDVELGRRSVYQDANFTFMMRLDVDNGEESSIQLQADYANMKNLQKELESAVAEAKTAHSMRFQRYIV
uniref:COMM domain-containing protein n=1 Tax=Florenciella parvula TaxID=236787 RepID=A0A7S2FVU4_9STRA|mmetsp:Transcript_2550/g.5622  ORF Transcript_2550/g.5622 Transcript_2550/m.5622 type:complete len:204 (+) Transcript_2550:162-773(+)